MSASPPLRTDGPTTTRRNLTLLCSDLSGSTQIAGRLEAEDYSELLERLHGCYQEAISRHGGQIAQISGDGMLAFFGYPELREGDARRAVAAAIDLHRRVSEIGRVGLVAALRLHSGIHAGLVLVQEGDSVRGRFELHGTATNLAFRLCDLAGGDEILVSEETLGPDRHFFVTGDRRLLGVKGRDAPVPAFAVLGPAPVGSRFQARTRGRATPFVGRRAALAALVAGLATPATGRARFVALVGPAGVGKTRLAEEVLTHALAAGWQVHRGECEEGAEPLQPFFHILRSIFRLDQSLSSEAQAADLARTLVAIDPALQGCGSALQRLLLPSGGERDAAALRDEIAALATVLGRLAERQPLVLFVDDWHLADDASRQIVDTLRGLDRHAILILATARTAPDALAPAPGADVLPVEPLPARDAAELATLLVPGADPFAIEALSASAGGNPLFLEELCHAHAHSAYARQGGGGAWLDTMIERRVAWLPEAAAAAARAAAVIGTVVPVWLLEFATGSAADPALMAALAEQDLLFPGERPGTLRFKHGVTRDAIYESVGLGERRRLHARIAEALRARRDEIGDGDGHARLAYHYGGARDAASSAHHFELAGDNAMALPALDRAQAYYRAALDAFEECSDYDTWSHVARKFGLAAVFAPARDQLDVFAKARELALAHDDAGALARAEYWAGYILYALGEARAAIAHCHGALAAAGASGDDRLIVQIRATLGQARAATGDYAGALPLLDEAVAVKRHHRSGRRPSVGLAYSLACRAFIFGDQSRFAEAHADFEAAMAAVHDADHEVEGSVLCQHSAVALWRGRPDEARRLAADAERVSARARTLYLFAMSRALGGYARWMSDGDPAAIDTVAEATSWLERGRRWQFISLNYGFLAEGFARAGRRAEARRFAARALHRARQGDRLGAAMARRALAHLAAQAGDWAAADRQLAAAVRVADARGAPHETAATRLREAELTVARGDPARAAALADDVGRAARAAGMTWHAAEAERIRALAAGH